jgi:hypothetical protein
LDIAMHVDPLPTSIDHSSQVPHVVLFFFWFESLQTSPTIFLTCIQHVQLQKDFPLPWILLA